MSAIKGFVTSDKEKRDGSFEFANVVPVAEKQHGLMTVQKAVFEAATDAVEANSTETVINATAHAAKVGDLIRFTSGTFDGKEVSVIAVDTNTITIAETLSAAPNTADTFQILRFVTQTLNAAGSIAVTTGPVEFVRDSVDTQVTEDTVTPANNRPLPVKLMDVTGDINITANDLNVQLGHTGANPDSVQIGDGTETVAINGSNEMQVADDTARTSLATIAGDTTSIDGKTPSLGAAATASSVPVNIASDQTVPVSAASLPLPTGAASESTLSTLNGKFTDGTDIGDVTINNAGGASAVNIQDGGNSITVDSTDLGTIAGAVVGSEMQVDVVASLPAGTNNIGDVDIASALPAGTNTIGAVDVNTLDVVDFMDTPLLDASSTNIPGSASTPVTVVASLAAAVKKIQVMDTTGEFIGIYSDPAGSPVLEAIYGPGSDQTVEVNLPASTVIGLRNMATGTVSVGNVALNFIG